MFHFLLALTMLVSAGNYPNYGSALEAAKQDGKPIVIVFTASWCGPCTSFKGSTLKDEAVLKELKDNFHFLLVDTDKSQALAKSFKVSSIPVTKIVSADEKELASQVGIQSKSGMIKWLEKYRK